MMAGQLSLFDLVDESEKKNYEITLAGCRGIFEGNSSDL